MLRTIHEPSRVPRTRGPRTSRKNSTASSAPSSTAVTSSSRPRTAVVARPAARRLRTQSTSPKGAISHRGSLAAPAELEPSPGLVDDVLPDVAPVELAQHLADEVAHQEDLAGVAGAVGRRVGGATWVHAD